jgi:hypothetical protein
MRIILFGIGTIGAAVRTTLRVNGRVIKLHNT